MFSRKTTSLFSQFTTEVLLVYEHYTKVCEGFQFFKDVFSLSDPPYYLSYLKVPFGPHCSLLSRAGQNIVKMYTVVFMHEAEDIALVVE